MVTMQKRCDPHNGIKVLSVLFIEMIKWKFDFSVLVAALYERDPGLKVLKKRSENQLVWAAQFSHGQVCSEVINLDNCSANGKRTD